MNPSQAAYLAGLQRCFPDWGGKAAFEWTFDRAVGGPAADRFTLHDGEALLAGSAVSYRRIAFPDGSIALAGIMTGSWTLPEARGRGCFARCIEESRRLADARGASALLAFVTSTNASARQLARAGAAMVPASYLSASAPAGLAGPTLTPIDDPAREAPRVLAAIEAASSSRTRVAYPDVDAWCSQFIARPLSTELLTDGAGAWAVVERAPDTDRVLAIAVEPGAKTAPAALMSSLVQRAARAGRKTFAYATDPADAASGRAAGFRALEGSLAVLPSSPRVRSVRVQAGDRM